MIKYVFSQCRFKTIALLILQTLRTAGTIGVAMLLNILIDTVSKSISTNETTRLISCTVFCCIYAASLGLIILLTEKCKASVIRRTMLKLRHDIISGSIDKSVPEFMSVNNAEYITLLNQNLTTLEDGYIKNLLSLYESVISILFGVGMLIYINPIIAVVSIAVMTIPSLIPKLFGKKLAESQARIMRSTAGYNVNIKDTFNGFEVIKTFGVSGIMKARNDKAAEAMESSRAAFADRMAWVHGIATMASVSVQFLVMATAGFFAVKGLITIGSIIAITQLTGQVISPAFQLSAKLTQLKSTKPIREQVRVFYSAEGSVEQPNRIEMQRRLSMTNVSFAYNESKVLDDVNAVFERGKKYAVVGKSGCGKSTLLKLLAGYYSSYDGVISVDEDKNALCDMAMIAQDVFLFDDTIRNNITLYRDYSETDIADAVYAAGLDGLIASLECGLDTQVEENGSRFSGGEKQRIAIARAFLFKKNLLLLDEATSALDNECAALIERSVLSRRDTTCIAITHRLNADTLREFNEILVMDSGKIVGKGSFDDLMEKSITFGKLFGSSAT